MRFTSRFAGISVAVLAFSGIVMGAGPAVAAPSAVHKMVAPKATATAANASVHLTWTSAGSGTSSYRIFRSTTSSVSTTGTPVKSGISASTRSWTNTGLTNGKTYYYRVQAVHGTSHATSTVVHAKPVAPLPTAPRAVTATAAAASITVKWTRGANTTSFKVYRATSSSVPTTGTSRSGTLAATTTSFKDTAVAGGTTYYYRVVAIGAGGQAASATVHGAIPVANAPGAPTDVKAVPSTTTMVVSWVGGVHTTGFKVFRSTSATVPTTGTPVSGATALTGSATSFIDTSVAAATTYYYVVVAVGTPATLTTSSATSAAATSFSGRIHITSPAASLTSTVDVGTAGVATVTNTGKGRLTISSVALSGTTAAKAMYALSDPPAAFVIEPGASHDVGVTFTPVTTGNSSINIVITSDDSATPTVTGTIRGAGTVGNFGSLQPASSEWASLIGQQFAPMLKPALTDLRLVFNRIGYDQPDKTDTLHTQPTATEVFTNTGANPVTITDLHTTGSYAGIPNWSILDAPTLPVTVAPGDSISVTLQFDYCRLSCTSTTHPAIGVVYGTLVVVSDDPGHETSTVLLAGGWQADEGGLNELPLSAWVNGILGITTVLSTPAQPINYHNGAVEAVGDEVLSTSWAALDPTQPVYVRQIVATHGPGGSEPFFWYTNKDLSTKQLVLQQAGTDYQTVLPGGNTSSNAEGKFSPAAAVFQLDVANTDYSDDSLNPTAKDIQHGCVPTVAIPCGHHIRFYPVKDADGNVVTGLYLMAVDTTGNNLDFQDEVYLLSNVTPAAS